MSVRWPPSAVAACIVNSRSASASSTCWPAPQPAVPARPGRNVARTPPGEQWSARRRRTAPSATHLVSLRFHQAPLLRRVAVSRCALDLPAVLGPSSPTAATTRRPPAADCLSRCPRPTAVDVFPHPPAHQRPVLDGHQRRFVRPVPTSNRGPWAVGFTLRHPACRGSVAESS